ncbi:MAG: lipopolysaccharide heptosyltransferase II [Nitrospinae bacterium]|nr:lipopolysaccharide heptosyltransferase II [Nitrospinota bacterium]
MKILIRCPNWIGDVMLSIPSISLVREIFPSAHISILIKSNLSPLFDGNPDINEIISFNPDLMSVTEKLKFYRGLKEKNFDLAILLTNSFESALFIYLAGIKERIGYNKDMRGIFLTEKIPMPSRKYPRMHQADFYLTLIEAFLEARGERREARDKKLFFCIPEDIQKDVDEFWNEKGLSKKSPVIGMNIGASYGSAKRWFPERFAELADRIYSELKGEVILFGGSGDFNIEAEIKGRMQNKALSMVGKTTLKSLAAMIKRCHLFITNDSGPMHIAAAVGTPIVAIFGSTDPSETSPLCDKYKIVKRPVDCSPCWKRECPTDHKCMELISVSDVMDAVKELISSHDLSHE